MIGFHRLKIGIMMSEIKQQHIKPWEGYPMPFNEFTQVKGDPIRHIEQLWDEVKKLRGEINHLKSYVRRNSQP
jgi:hypothetical protein